MCSLSRHQKRRSTALHIQLRCVAGWSADKRGARYGLLSFFILAQLELLGLEQVPQLFSLKKTPFSS